MLDKKILINDFSWLEFTNIARDVIDNSNGDWSNVGPQIFRKASEYAKQKGIFKNNSECNLIYDYNKPEIYMWIVSLISACWTAEIWRRKTRDEHCYTHKKESGKCDKGKLFHRKIRQECIELYKQIIKQLENIPEGYQEEYSKAITVNKDGSLNITYLK